MMSKVCRSRGWLTTAAVYVLVCTTGAWAQTTGVAGKTITVTGSEQSSGSTYDTGTIAMTINGYAKTLSYGVGQYSVPASVASYVAAHISEDTSETVWAQASGSVITLVPRIPGSPVNITTAAETPTSGISTSFTFSSGSTTASPALVVLCDPSSIGPSQTANCTATIGGGDALEGDYAPTGTMTFQVNSSTWMSGVAVNSEGIAVAEGLSESSAGTYTITANYAPGTSDHYSSMSATTTVTVGSSAPSTTGVYQYKIKQSDGSTSGYDGVGNITAYYDFTSGQWNNIQYDALNRLVRADGPTAFNGSSPYFCWTYDNFGNRTGQNSGTSAFSWSSGSCSGGGTTTTDTQSYNSSNQLTGATHPSGSFSYDAAGNTTVDPNNNSYVYDAEGRLCAMSTWSTVTDSYSYTGYLYDAEGNRVAKGTHSTLNCSVSDFTMTNMYVLDQGGRTMTETDGSGNWQHTDVGANGELIATYAADSLHFQFSDWLGTRRVQTDYAGANPVSFQSLPYGELLSSLSGDTTEKHFTGQEHDTESGNDYFKARYDTSNMGRFMSPDFNGDDEGPPEPVPYADFSDPQSLNLYAYVQNNPLVRFDSGGHVCIYINNDTGAYEGTDRGDCDNSDPNKANTGHYVDGTVDTIIENRSGQVTGFSGTSYSGNLMTGAFASPLPYDPTEGPAYFAGANLIGNTAGGVVNGVGSVELNAIFPWETLAADLLSGSSSNGVQAAGISRKPGTLGMGKGTDALRRENKIASDIAKKLGADKNVVHGLLQEGSQIEGKAFTYREGLEYVAKALGKLL